MVNINEEQVEKNEEKAKAKKSKSRLAQIIKVFAHHKVVQNISKQKNPDQVRIAFEELGPTFIKAGQILSTRSDIITAEFSEELKKLQDGVKTDDFQSVKNIIEEETGHTIEDIFEEFSEEPLASASIAQIHAATLKGGQRVVVKIQHPGIFEKMSLDIELMEKAVVLTKYIPSGTMTDPAEVVKELKNSLMEELDFTKEAANIEKFNELNGNVHYIRAPKIYETFSTKRILIMDFMQGVQIAKYIDQSNLEIEKGNLAVGEIKKRLAKELIDNYLKQVFDDGYFHADPHPGNILITLDETAIPEAEVGADHQTQAEQAIEAKLKEKLPLDLEGKIAGIDISAIFRNQDVLEFFAGKATLEPTEYGPERIVYIDFGMMGNIDEQMIKKFNNILVGMYERNPQKAGNAVLDLCNASRRVDKDGFASDVEKMLDYYYELSLNELSLTEAFKDIKELCEKHSLKLPACITLLFKGIGTIEGIVLSLDPECSIMTVLEPYAKRYIKENFDPEKEVKKALKTFYNAGKAIPELPIKASKALDIINKGEIKINMETEKFEGLTQQVETIVNRLILGVIAAALIISSSLIIQFSELNSPLSVVGICGYVVALVIIAGILLKTLVRRKKMNK